MYAVIVTFQTTDEAANRFRQRVVQQAKDSLQNEDGCLAFDVWTSSETPDTIFLYEIYTDRAAFDLHIETAHFKAFDADVQEMVKSKTVVLQDRALWVGIRSGARA